MKFRHLSLLFLFASLHCNSNAACTSANDSIAPLPSLEGVEVLIATDHTLPEHYGEASAGAEGRERTYIDPAADIFFAVLGEQGISAHIARVEDRLCSGALTHAGNFSAAYTSYDQLLTQAAAAGITIVALHFDADRLPPEASLETATYIGGAQIIIDGRAVSTGTAALTQALLSPPSLLDNLAAIGFRLRPDYEKQLRVQNNQTLLIAGHSAGGGLLVELGPQQQARENFGSPEAIAQAALPALKILALTIKEFRAKSLKRDMSE